MPFLDRAYVPLGSLAPNQDSVRTLPTDDNLEGNRQHTSEKRFRTDLRIRRRSIFVFGVLTCGALVAVAIRVGKSVGLRGQLGEGIPQEFWLRSDIYGPCPKQQDWKGGVPRTPLFNTIAQAWVCLNKNGDNMLQSTELGPGAGVASVDYRQFHEHIRQNRDRLVAAGSPESQELKKWVELVLKFLPRDEHSPMWYNVSRMKNPDEAVEAAALTDGVANPELLGAEPVDSTKFMETNVASVVDALLGVAPPPPQPKKVGQVNALYTFGAPAITRHAPLTNPARADGCFPGIRAYSRGSHRVDDYEVRFAVSDPIAWVLSVVGFYHNRAAVLSVNDDVAYRAGYSSCEDGWNGPKADLFFWYEGHRTGTYQRNFGELDDLLGVRDWHEKHVEENLRADPASMGAFPAAGSESPDVATAEELHSQNPFRIGNYVRIKKDKHFVQQKYKEVVYAWHDEMEPMLGQVFPVIRVSSPGFVGLPSANGADNDGIWYFPVAVLEPVSPEVANAMLPRFQDGCGDDGFARRLQDGWRRGAAAESQKEPTSDKCELVRKGTAYQRLASIGYEDDDMHQYIDAADLGFQLVSHVMVPSNDSGITPQASLFQDPKTQECVVSWGIRMNQRQKKSRDYRADPEYYRDNPVFGRSIYTWWSMFGGFEPTHDDMADAVWAKVDTFENQMDSVFEHPVVSEEHWTGRLCTVRTNMGTRPCPKNMTKAMRRQEKLFGMSHITRTKEWCGISGIQEYFADSMRSFTRSRPYKYGITSKISQCRNVTAVGHNIGGALAALWTTCSNAKLEEGEAGFEDFKHAGWDYAEAGNLRGFMPDAMDPDVFMLRNKKTGKVLDLHGTLADIKQGRGELTLVDANYDGKEQRWTLSPEGFLRNNRSGLCLGVDGVLGAEDPERNVGISTIFQTCHYDLASTAQLWNFTEQGFLENGYTGLCLSKTMQLITCPMSDQIWQYRTDGFVVNQLSGKCLDIEGEPGVRNGARALLWPCEFTNPDTDQRWDFSLEGFLKNKRSGKCLDVSNLNGVFHAATLVLWDCVKTTTVPVTQLWKLGPNGNLVNKLTGKCVDVEGNSQVQKGSPIVLWACDRYHVSSTASAWELLANGQIVNRGDDLSVSGQCISADWHDSRPELVKCTTRTRQRWSLWKDGRLTPAMSMGVCVRDKEGKIGVHACLRQHTELNDKWFIHKDGFLMNRRTRRCIDVDQDGIMLSVREGHCHMTDQKWELKTNGQVKNELSGKCLHVEGGISRSSGKSSNVVIRNCLSGALSQNSNEVWDVIPNGGLIKHKPSGLCLDVEGNPTYANANGVKLILNDCDPTRLLQRWMQVEKDFLKNEVTGKCIDVFGPAGHSDGQPVVLYDCEYGGKFTDQTWELLGAYGQVRPVEAAFGVPQDVLPDFSDEDTQV